MEKAGSLGSQGLLRHQTVPTEAIEHRLGSRAIGMPLGTLKPPLKGRPLPCQRLLNRRFKRGHLRFTQESHIPLFTQGGDRRSHHRATSRQVLEEFHRVHVTGVVVDLQRQQGHIGMGEIGGEAGVRPRTQLMHVGEALPSADVCTGIGLANRPDEQVGPMGGSLDQGLEHVEIELVGIDRTDEDEHRPLGGRPINRARKIGLERMTKMDSISHIAETMAAGIQRSKRRL